MVTQNQARLEMEYLADKVEATLAAHRTPGRIIGGIVGLTTHRLDLQPAPHVRYAQIERLADDIALALGAPYVNISRVETGIAIEFPSKNPKALTLTDLLANFGPLPLATAALGLAVDGAPLCARLTSPDVAHILVAGTTGCGKSNLLRAITASLAVTNDPSQLALLLIDPKRRTFPHNYAPPHLLKPVIADPHAAFTTLQSVTALMDHRDRTSENRPHLIVVIDELADLIMGNGGGIEPLLIRLAQSGRQTGIHLIAATQRPSAAIVAGLMRANFPLRLVGRTVSAEDSRIAAGRGGVGAERLAGRGDFVAVSGSETTRFQVPLVKPADLLLNTAPHTYRVDVGPSLTLPDPTPEPHALPAPTDLDILTARLQPWWDQNRHRWAAQEWGIQKEAIGILFPGDPNATNAGCWRETMLKVIERLEAGALVPAPAPETTTTELLPTYQLIPAFLTG